MKQNKMIVLRLLSSFIILGAIILISLCVVTDSAPGKYHIIISKLSSFASMILENYRNMLVHKLYIFFVVLNDVIVRHIRSVDSMTGHEVVEADPDPAPDDDGTQDED